MTVAPKIRKIGNSLGVVLPKEALLALNVTEGDSIYLTEAPDSSLRVTADRPGFEEIIAADDYAAWLRDSCGPV